ncbi:hypothetical protein J5N97_028176 [Dioscorea zingiberensis]|uniref:Uncharacterized protein n=1 Tax=Dioscorea zingiberensis TaxID=325984 RepID=A0A9D5BYM0_9LILI|nr:hypothetical protein J5N97_028176 [Dioscorea zingiberensis]
MRKFSHTGTIDWSLLEQLILDRQEDGWVVCRVFKKKNNQRGIPPEQILEEDQLVNLRASSSAPINGKHIFHQMEYDHSLIDNSMHLPQLLSSEQSAAPFMPSLSLNALDLECTQNLMKLMTSNGEILVPQEKFNGDWSILDKLLGSHHNLDQFFQNKAGSTPLLPPPPQLMNMGSSSAQRFPLQYLGSETDLMKFTK